MSDLILHELPPSPNNQKVRIGLGFKGLEYERKILQFESFPGDRTAIVEASGQPRTPVLVHGDRSIFDSGAILRYLEANFRDTPPLFSEDYGTMGTIERWEWFARKDLAEPVGLMFQQAFSPDRDAEAIARANGMVQEMTACIEEQLTGGPFLVGERLTAADVTAVPLIYLAMLPPEAATGPVTGFFVESYRLGDGRERTRDWVRRVLAHDAHRG